MDEKLCYGCKESTTALVFTCSSDHKSCKECAIVFKKKCRCGEDLLRARRRQEQESGLKTCKYKSRGCTWVFDQADDLLLHSEECRFRTCQCIGRTMNVWNCLWEGSKFQVDEHLKKNHRSAINIFNYQEENLSYHFDLNKRLYKKIDVIEAFSKTFILYYQFDRQSELIIFMIYLLGTTKDAKKYLYDFEILSDNVNKKIKFKQPCFSDVAVWDLIQNGKCIILPYKMMQDYLTENTIRIRFRMGKVTYS